MLRILLYFGLAIASLAILGFVFAITVRTGITISATWGWLVLFTGVLIFTMLKIYRPYWRRSGFWIALAGALAAHSVIFILLLRAYPEFKPAWYVPIIVAEAVIFGTICGAVLDNPSHPLHHRKRL